MSDARVNSEFGPGQPADSTQPASTTTTLGSPKSMVQAARVCAGSYADTVMVADYGFPLFYAFALIIVVWTGLQMMFGGQFSLGEVVNLALLLGVPYTILTYYDTPAPFLGGYTFPEMVTGMGSVVAEALVEGAYRQFVELVTTVTKTVWGSANLSDAIASGVEAAKEGDAGGAIANFIMGGIRAVVASYMVVVVFAFAVLIVVLIILPAIITYCSYLWGQVALLVAVVIGPLFVPMMLIPQLSFLFWGWFKSLLGASVHMMIAGAVFAVSAQLMSIPLLRLQTIFVDLMDGGVWLEYNLAAPFLLLSGLILEMIPLWIIALLGAFKVGELTSLIMNGGAMPSSGMGDRMRQLGQARSAGASGMRLLMGGGAAAAGAAAATGGAALAAQAAGQVLSSATKMNK